MQRPRLDPEDSCAEPERGRYRRSYALAGAPGEVLVQEVEIEVRYWSRRRLLVDYRSRYAEFFRLGAGPARDIHDFDPNRDGWSRRHLRWLLHRHVGRPTWRDRGGPSRLHYRKRFVLGRGEVEATKPLRERADGAAFGFLTEGPSGASVAELRLTREHGEAPLELRPRTPWPLGMRGAGRGWLEAARAWCVEETLEYDFEASGGGFDDGGGYAVVELGAGLG